MQRDQIIYNSIDNESIRPEEMKAIAIERANALEDPYRKIFSIDNFPIQSQAELNAFKKSFPERDRGISDEDYHDLFKERVDFRLVYGAYNKISQEEYDELVKEYLTFIDKTILAEAMYVLSSMYDWLNGPIDSYFPPRQNMVLMSDEPVMTVKEYWEDEDKASYRVVGFSKDWYSDFKANLQTEIVELFNTLAKVTEFNDEFCAKFSKILDNIIQLTKFPIRDKTWIFNSVNIRRTFFRNGLKKIANDPNSIDIARSLIKEDGGGWVGNELRNDKLITKGRFWDKYNNLINGNVYTHSTTIDSCKEILDEGVLDVSVNMEYGRQWRFNAGTAADSKYSVITFMFDESLVDEILKRIGGLRGGNWTTAGGEREVKIQDTPIPITLALACAPYNAWTFSAKDEVWMFRRMTGKEKKKYFGEYESRFFPEKLS